MNALNIVTRAIATHPDTQHRQLTLDAISTRHQQRAVHNAAKMQAHQLKAWLDFADRNLVGPLAAHVILDSRQPHRAIRERAEESHAHAAQRMKVLMAELDGVAERLSTAGIPLVALKNAGIARGVYPCAACCPMGDVDVLVRLADFREAHRLVLELGFQLASRGTVEEADLEEGLKSGGTEYVKRTANVEVWLELQWRAVAGRWIRPEQEPKTDQLMERSVAIPETKVRLLHPVDNMVQVALHTAKHSFVRAPGLRLHTDVDRLAAYSPPDWASFVEAVHDLGVTVPCYFSLALAATLLDSNVPPQVLEALSPHRWRQELILRWLNHVDLFEPSSPKFKRPEMLVFHAMLYDEPRTLVASILDTDAQQLGLRHLPRNIGRGIRRMSDLITRYQA